MKKVNKIINSLPQEERLLMLLFMLGIGWFGLGVEGVILSLSYKDWNNLIYSAVFLTAGLLFCLKGEWLVRMWLKISKKKEA